MPFEESHEAPEFKAWLVRTLEPLCDADPVVLSDYIIALLKHEANYDDAGWKDFMTRELVDFMDEQSRPFVDNLWSTLQSRSYISAQPIAIAPAAAAAAQQTAAAAAAAGGSSGNVHAPSVVSSYRPPSAPKALREGQGQQGSAAQRPQQGQNQQAGPSRQAGQQGGKKRGQCHDYHNKGFCLRGVNCPYEHSDDVIIPSAEMMMPMMGGPGGPGQNGGGPQHGQPGQGQPFPGMDMSPFPFPFPFPMMPFMGQQPGGGPHQQQQHQQQGGRRGRGNNSGTADPSSEFWGSKNPPHHTERTSTLVITDIPVTHLTVPSIRDYFSQFGEVTNIAIEGKSKRALVSFGNNREAYIAWKSDEAVFGSRHVKVLWHRPREGQGEAGMAALAASKGLLDNMKRMEGGEEVQGGKSVQLYGPEQRLKATLLELEAKEKRQKKETLMAEQKVLMVRASKATDRDEKVQILGRVKEVMKELEDLEKPTPVVQEMDVDMDNEGTEEARLLKELEKHGMDTKDKRDEAELLKLNAQLAALKDKASSLGIASPQSRYSPYPSRGTRGRGRGRGAGAGVGRGAGASGFHRPLSLDNRSRAITVAGDGLEAANDDGKKALRDWYESHGGSVEVDAGGRSGSWKIGFPSREMAERVLALGTKQVPGFTGDLSTAWDAASTPTTSFSPGNGNGHGSPAGAGGAAGRSGASSLDIHMGEETRRGDREDDE